MTNEEIKLVLKTALETLYHTDKVLIEDKAHEQSISARLMCHLQQLLPEWHVDVEFNRQGENRVPKTDAEGVNRKPDVIIHKRGYDGPNLALILVKCEWNTEQREKDRLVAKSLKKRHEYQAAYVLEIKQTGYHLEEV